MKAFYASSSRRSKKDRTQSRLRHSRSRPGSYDGASQRDQDFRCQHCGLLVTGEPLISGVRNRNHCPYCLYSRHVDLYQAGDRLSACKAEMEPVGLTLKQTRKKYQSAQSGELMLVHACTGCGKISINRIAADDDAQSLLAVFHGTASLDRGTKDQLEQDGIKVLGADDLDLVRTILFGKIQRT